MSYPDLFKRALALWWRTRGLWPLGMLAALVGSGDYSTGSLNFNQTVSGDDPSDLVPPEQLEQLANNPLLRTIIENPIPIIVGFVIVVLLLSLIFSLIGQLAHGAMIRMADRADRGYEASIGDALRVGTARLLPMFLISLLVVLPLLLMIGLIVLVVVLAITQIVAATESGSNVGATVFAALGGLLLCVIPLFLLILVLNIALSLFARIAQRVCVLEDRGPIASFARSWRLITRNIGNTLLTWIATALLGAGFGFVLTLPLLIFGIPAMIGFVESGNIPWGFVIGGGIYSLLVTVLLGGWLTSFNSALWTVLYRSFLAREQTTPVPASYAPGD
jgi:uncharacterized membrane protein